MTSIENPTILAKAVGISKITAAGPWLLVVAPIVVAAGSIARPFVSDFTGNELTATVIAGGTQRWEAAGILIAAGVALMALALPLAVRQLGVGDHLERWVGTAATIGAVLVALQAGLVSLGAAVASRMGANVVEFLDASGGLNAGLLLAGLLAFAVAWIGVIAAVWASPVTMRVKWIVTVGGAFAALGNLYPSSIGEYAAAIGIALALWTIAATGLVGRSPAGEALAGDRD